MEDDNFVVDEERFAAPPTPEEARAYLLSRLPDLKKVPRMFLKDAAKLAVAAEAFLKAVNVEGEKP